MLPDPNAPLIPDPSAPVAPTAAPMLPLPPGADLAFWRDEIDRSERIATTHHTEWQENIDWFSGQSPDARTAVNDKKPFVNVNVDFYQVEQKLAQLFYETPDLQLTVKGGLVLRAQMPGAPPVPASTTPASPTPQPGAMPQPPTQAQIVYAHRLLMNEILGDEHADILSTVQHAIKDCLCVGGMGPVILGYEPTMRNGVAVYQQWYGLNFSLKKFLMPADFASTDWDRAPWLGMRVRLPLVVTQREFPAVFAANPDFKGATETDEHVLNDQTRGKEPSGMKYADLIIIWYRAAQFDPMVQHPEQYRELVLIDGIDAVARHRDSPHQEFTETGQLTGDSLIGNPIHPLTIRTVPDSSYVPSDSQMTRPLVRELCKFRTQMVQERDVTRPRYGFDSEKLTPPEVTKLVNGELGDLIALEGGSLAQGVQTIIANLIPQGTRRESYVANDYITHDIEKTLAIDATGAGTNAGSSEESATKTATVDRNRAVRLDAERRQVLRWYLKLVYKLSALVCRYMTPDVVAQWIGQEQAQIWAQWDRKASDGRVSFDARPDSQVRLDAAAERKFALDLYNFTAKDPNSNRVELLKNLFTKAGLDVTKAVIEQVPQKEPEPNVSLAFKGEDFVGPQGDQVREVLAKLGIAISQQAVTSGATQMMHQVALGLRDATGKAIPPKPQPAEHGGPADQVRPLSKAQGDQTGNPSGRPPMQLEQP